MNLQLNIQLRVLLFSHFILHWLASDSLCTCCSALKDWKNPKKSAVAICTPRCWVCLETADLCFLLSESIWSPLKNKVKLSTPYCFYRKQFNQLLFLSFMDFRLMHWHWEHYFCAAATLKGKNAFCLLLFLSPPLQKLLPTCLHTAFWCLSLKIKTESTPLWVFRLRWSPQNVTHFTLSSSKLLPILSSKLLKECLLISWMLSLRAMAKSANAHRWPHLSSHCCGSESRRVWVSWTSGPAAGQAHQRWTVSENSFHCRGYWSLHSRF